MGTIRFLQLVVVVTPLFAGAQSPTYDATILSYEGLDRTCDGSITPVLKIQNTGSATMGTCLIDIWKNGLFQGSFNWVLAAPAVSGEVRKPALPTMSGLVDGDEIEFRIMDVNGQPDEEPIGNIEIREVLGESAPSDSYRVLVEVLTDGDPQETTWSLQDAAGNPVASGGPFADPNTLQQQWVDLSPTSCYAFRVEDSGGNGMSTRSGDGYVKVIGLGQEVIAIAGADFSDSYEDALRTNADGCAVTQLTTALDPVPSCGRAVYLNGTSSIQARSVAGADRYQFEFSRGAYVRRIATPSPTLTLTPWSTLPLKPGRIYQVRVRVSFDAGSTWCPFGASCDIRTLYPAVAVDRGMDASGHDVTPPTIVCVPNPAAGEMVTLLIHGRTGMDHDATLAVLDMTGRVLHSEQVNMTGGLTRHELHLGNMAASGTYLLVLRSDEFHATERVVIDRGR